MMTRRHFVGDLFKRVVSAAFFGVPRAYASRTSGNRTAASEASYYRPLKGRSIRALARRKVHHGDGVYINPFNDSGKGLIGSVLKWKLFSQNHFKPYYADERS